MRIDKKERNILIGLLVVLTLWFGFFLNKYYAVADGNVILFYIIFLLAYCFLISKFFFDDRSIKAIIIFFIVLLISDLLLPPYILSLNEIPDLTNNLAFSSDYLVYSLFPVGWEHQLKYYLTYIGFPILMWTVLALLFNRKKFMSLLKSAV